MYPFFKYEILVCGNFLKSVFHGNFKVANQNLKKKLERIVVLNSAFKLRLNVFAIYLQGSLLVIF